MDSGTISVSTKMHQFTRLIVFQIGQQVHLLGLCNDLRWNIWHKNPSFHSHELTAKKQSGYVKGPAGLPNRPRAVIALYPLSSFVFALRTWPDPLRSARCPPEPCTHRCGSEFLPKAGKAAIPDRFPARQTSFDIKLCSALHWSCSNTSVWILI